MRRCAWVLPALLWALIAAHAQAAAPATSTASGSSASKLLDDWDHAQRALREAVWSLYAGTAAMGKDARGRTISDDLDAWVMTDSVRAQLRAVRARAVRLLQEGDEQGARAVLAAGRAMLQEQTRRLTLIGVYRWRQLALDRQRMLWRRWLKEAPDNVAGPSRARIGALESALSSSFSPSMTVSELERQLDDLNRAYNEERMKLAQAVSQQRVAAGESLGSRDRTLPCPAPVEDTRPPVDQLPPRPAGGVDVEQFYPPSDSHAGIAGRVILKLFISPQGCMKHAEVHRSSGAPGLDEAAMEMAERMSFFPARKHGRAVSGSFLMAFSFQMNGERFAASPGARPDPLAQPEELLSRGDYPGAISALDAILKTDPADAAAVADRGIAHIWNHELDLGRADLDRALALDPRNFVALRGEAILALRTRAFARSVAEFTAALKVYPEDLYSIEARAEAAMLSGQIDQALAYNADALKAWPGRPDLYVMRAFMLRAQHRTQEALAQASALTQARPLDPAAYRAAASIYAASGREADALHAADQAVRLSPSVSTYLAREAFRPLSDRAGRHADINAALNLDPDSVQAALALVQLQLDAGDYPGALATATQALKRHADNDLLMIQKVIALLKTGQFAAGEEALTEVRARARTPDALNTLCWDLATANVALGRALDACNAALKIEPLAADILDSRGFVLLRLGRYAEALQSYNEALKSMPFEVASLYGRGLVRQRQGMREAAQGDLQAALALDAHIAGRFARYGLRPEG